MVGSRQRVTGGPIAGLPYTGLATINGIAQTPRFSPDGERIAVLVTLDAGKESGATQPGVRLVGEIGEKNDEQRIAVFDVGGVTTNIKPVSPADRYVYEYDWTPDGKGFVATTALGNGDNNWWVATLDAIDATTGAVRNIARPKTQLDFPRISPDGKTVAYIGGLMSDFGPVGGDVWTVPFAGGAPVDVTAKQPVTFTSLAWVSGGLRASYLRGNAMGGAAIDPRGRVTPLIDIPDASLGAGDGRIAWAADGRTFATVTQRYDKAPAIHAGSPGAVRQLTHDNDGLTPSVSAQSISWKSDGYDVQGWLVGPRVTSTGKAPMIVTVHGGPSSATSPRFVGADSAEAALTARGYYLFYPNPRGSYGQGEAFTAANKRDFGGGDLRDILAGVDAVEKVAPIDDARLGLTGGSYGGFMAMWANTQTNRFKAIVAGAGLSNWISYYGTNGIDQWMIPFFGKSAYDDPEAYAKVSAITYIKKARTPTFIYVGERDIEVPPGQSIEYWHALKELGVPTTLMIYPDEGHGIRQPEHVADLKKRVFAWWAQYLGAK
ncbi:MAG: family peptidase [Sphingomonas bacterium]|nr:family peptidase [Sphingomonas bacterium]